MREGHNESFVRRLEELGWEEVLKVDAATALRVLFEIKGETLSSVDALGPELVRVASLTDPSVGPNHSILLPSPLSNPRTSGDTVKVEGVTSATNLGSQVIFFTGEQLSTCASSHLTISPLQGTDDSANRRLVHGEVPIASVARLSNSLVLDDMSLPRPSNTPPSAFSTENRSAFFRLYNIVWRALIALLSARETWLLKRPNKGTNGPP